MATRSLRRFAALVALSLGFAGSGQAAALEGPELGDALRKGGYVIYIRHTSTNFSQNDSAMGSFEDCARQRNLTDTGRAEAKAIGVAIRRAGIPVGEVLASPYCRTVETARLIFGRATPATAVRGGPASADGDRYLDLKKLFSAKVPAGTNLALASHGNPFQAVAGPPYLAEGEAAIVAPGGPDGFTVVAHVRNERVGRLGGEVAFEDAGSPPARGRHHSVGLARAGTAPFSGPRTRGDDTI